MYNFINQKIRASAILTSSYVAATTIEDVATYNELAIYCYFTLGSLTSLNIKVESSIDGTNYVTETFLTVSGATGTLNKGVFNTTEDGNFKITVPMSARFVKVSAQGVGTATSSLLEIWSFLHTV